MHQIVKISDEIMGSLPAMFDELGEQLQTLTPDSARPLVVHRVMGQMTLVRAGAGYASADGQTIAITAGDLLVLGPGCEHSFYALENELQLSHWHWPQALLHEDRIILQPVHDFGLDGDRAGSAP